jgi:CRISPR-associated protein Cas1
MQPLIINDYGAYLGKHSERLVVRYRDKERSNDEHALMDLEQVIISSRGVSLSSDLVQACTERGIEISFLGFNGQPYAKLLSPALSATVISRREQLAAYQDERGFEISQRFVRGKLQNQINLVRYFGKYRKKRAPKQYAEMMERVRKMQELLKELDALEATDSGGVPTDPTRGELKIDAMRPTLLNLEGRAGALYWECVQRLLPGGKFQKREHRGAQDEVNVLLNYGYGILYSQVWSALALAGLEPFAGFLHVDRPGKPSLVLDFIEEFRQTVVDRVVFAMTNKRFKVEWEAPDSDIAREAHQSAKVDGDAADSYKKGIESEQRRLSKDTRRALADRVLGRLQETEVFERKQQRLTNIIQQQARHLAMFLRRERDYQPFVARW